MSADYKIEVWSTVPHSKGGQHVGTGPNGVRVTHVASGMQASVDIERSQHKNCMLAMHMIEAALTHPSYKGPM